MQRKRIKSHIFAIGVLIASLTGFAAVADERVETARSDGVWQVQSGDTLYGIARKLYPNDAGTQAKLRSGLLVLNREAFANGVPEGLIVDSTLKMPGFVIEKLVDANPLPEPAVEVAMEEPEPEPVANISEPEPEADFVGKVIFARGQMTAQQTDGKVRSLSRNSAIYEGDKITTPDRGFGQLQLTDGALLAIRPDSQLEIEEFTYNGAQDGTESSILRLIRGGFRTITGAVGKTNKRKYRVTTTVATLGIRGTHYGLRLCDPQCESPDGESQTGLFGSVVDGAISVTNDSGESVFENDEYFRVVSLLDTPEGLLEPPGVVFDGAETASSTPLSDDQKAALEKSNSILTINHAESSDLTDSSVDAVYAGIRIEQNLPGGSMEDEMEPTPDPMDPPTDPVDPVEEPPVDPVDPPEDIPTDPVDDIPTDIDNDIPTDIENDIPTDIENDIPTDPQE
ncbi:MAG: FecR domain-containing protein [Pseudomonadota bacterium]